MIFIIILMMMAMMMSPAKAIVMNNPNIAFATARLDQRPSVRPLIVIIIVIVFISFVITHKGSSINYVITFGGLGRPPPHVIS